jgi:hypothetical protein
MEDGRRGRGDRAAGLRSSRLEDVVDMLIEETVQGTDEES